MNGTIDVLINCFHIYSKQYGYLKIKIEQLYNTAIQLLVNFPQTWHSIDVCTSMLIETLFTVAKIEKQFKCIRVTRE